jgi:2-keto-4-pentenoate hydratase
MTMTINATRAARRLRLAAASRIPCAPVRDLLPSGDVPAAYQVQLVNVQERIAAGARPVGRKIGLTNPGVQAQLGVDQPDFGVLFDDMRCPPDEPIDVGRTLAPRIEAEIAFILAADLDDRVDPAAVAAATGQVVAALEIVDSRVAGWDITITDTVADNASSGLFALGDRRALGQLDLVACGMTMRRNGETVSTGRGGDCLGDPLAAVAWLANTAREYGQPLRAGEIILSGALGPMVPVLPGDAFTATITGIGTVSARFTLPAPRTAAPRTAAARPAPGSASAPGPAHGASA